MSKAFQKINHYLSLIVFSHTVFAMPFAVVGFLLGVADAGQFPGWLLFVKVLACMVFARSAAMAFNRYLDRDIDKRNPRTASREIPAGIIRPGAALVFVVVTSFLFMYTAWLINPLCFYLSPVALLVVLGYSYTKRFTWLCHFVLGTGLALAPIGAYLAVKGVFAWVPLIYSLVVLTWVSGFDVIYALQDEAFDREQQLKSLPVRLGIRNALVLSSLLHVLSAGLLLAAGLLGNTGWAYWLGFLVFVGLLLYQHLIVKADDLSRVNRAFGTTNGYASTVFAGFFLLDFLLH
ncbi:MAG: UbiA family prenyltransferase [Bacteroidia bacterium]|nr:putative 4-hydroxybenzoate polyprenyltransferase [Bacteroidia bacterium]MCC6768844.1 UbiA family prenyltransferase [Bacteroidia bacterium]